MDSSRAKTLTLVATILGSGIALLDGTIVNVALPAIEGDLGGGLAGQQWVVNAYLLTLGSLILLGGSLGDVYGERRIFTVGVASFGVASVLCAVAPTIETLVAARALQGMTSALLTPASLALIATTYAVGHARNQAMAVRQALRRMVPPLAAPGGANGPARPSGCNPRRKQTRQAFVADPGATGGIGRRDV